MSVKISQMPPASTEDLANLSSPKLEVSVSDGVQNLTRSVTQEVLTRRFIIPQQSTGPRVPRDRAFSVLKITDQKMQELAFSATNSIADIYLNDILCVSGTLNLHYSYQSNGSRRAAVLPFFVNINEFGNIVGRYTDTFFTNMWNVNRAIPYDPYSAWFDPTTLGIRDIRLRNPPAADGTVIDIRCLMLVDSYDNTPIDDVVFSGYADIHITVSSSGQVL